MPFWMSFFLPQALSKATTLRGSSSSTLPWILFLPSSKSTSSRRLLFSSSRTHCRLSEYRTTPNDCLKTFGHQNVGGGTQKRRAKIEFVRSSSLPGYSDLYTISEVGFWNTPSTTRIPCLKSYSSSSTSISSQFTSHINTFHGVALVCRSPT